MSGPDQEISISSGGGDEDGDEVVDPSGKDGVEEDGGEETEKGSKRVFLFRFGKAKKTLQLLRRKRRKKKKKKRKGGGFVNSGGCFGGWGDGGMVGCCLCGKQTAALDSSGESPSSDPNSKEFGFDRLRALIEKNDFYAVECNPHLDCSFDKT